MEQPTPREDYIPYLKAYIEQGLLPPIIYKYMPISEYLYKTLINSELWFSSPASFNDPFDCQIEDETDWNESNITQFLKSTLENKLPDFILEKEIANHKNNPAGFKEYFTKTFLSASLKGGVACFATTHTDPLLWAHYSAKHTGVCLVFDIREDYYFFGLTMRVNYVTDYPKFDFNKDTELVPKKVVTTKSAIWKYEDEVQTIQSYTGNYSFKKECLKEIIFGCKTNPNEIKTVAQLIKDAQYPNVKLRKVNLRKTDFGIDIIDI